MTSVETKCLVTGLDRSSRGRGKGFGLYFIAPRPTRGCCPQESEIQSECPRVGVGVGPGVVIVGASSLVRTCRLSAIVLKAFTLFALARLGIFQEDGVRGISAARRTTDITSTTGIELIGPA